jgi:hypothetical protein
MTDEFTNRFTMFETALGVLNSDDFKGVWLTQAPLVFTDKVAGAAKEVQNLDAFCTEQGVNVHGATMDKEAAQSKLEDLAHKLSRALVSYFRDKDNQTDAEKVNFKLYQWRGMRDAKLKENATVVRDLAQAAVDNDKGVAETYGINAAKVTALSDELAVWGNASTSPAQAVSKRKGMGTLFRQKFNGVSVLMHDLDDVILQFDETEQGRNMIAAFKAGRIVRDLGHGPKAKTPPPPPTP